jgi:CTP synthase
VSGLGKGITISSIGVIMKACGLRVSSIKIDPYMVPFTPPPLNRAKPD